MGAGHDHRTGNIQHEQPLWWAFGLTTAFLIAEVIALAILLVAVRLSRKPADAKPKRTYGYAYVEAIGATINGGLLFLVAGYIFWEAAGRFRQPPEVAENGMLVIAVLGLVVNLISMRLLKAGSCTSLNVKGAYLEVWADMLGSVGVFIGALVIKFTGWTLADPIIAVLIGLWVLPRTWTLLREAGQVLMQGVPAGLDLDAVRDMMLAHPASPPYTIYTYGRWDRRSRSSLPMSCSGKMPMMPSRFATQWWRRWTKSSLSSTQPCRSNARRVMCHRMHEPGPIVVTVAAYSCWKSHGNNLDGTYLKPMSA